MDANSQSLNMRFWPRRETILRPILWSPEDLQLFGCQFSTIHPFEPQTCEAACADDSSDHAALAERQARFLQTSSSPLVKRCCMEDILDDGKLYRQEREPSLRIGRRFISPEPFSFFLPTEEQRLARGGLLPMTGYIDYTMIHSARRKGNYRKLRPGQRDYGYSERLKRITPRAWTEDPYILFILLSMAQSQYHRKHGRHNTTIRVTLFITKYAFRQYIYLFDVDIPTALLDELDDPRIVPQRTTRLVIHRTRISIEPHKDLWARLVGALSSRGGGDAADGDGRRDGEGRQDIERQGDGADGEGCERQETLVWEGTGGNGNEPLQVLGIGAARLRKLQDAGVNTVHRLASLECYHIERLMSGNSPYGQELRHQLAWFPLLTLEAGSLGEKSRTWMVRMVIGLENKTVPTWKNRMP